MERGSDTADSGKNVVLYCVEINMSESLAMFPEVGKIHC